MPTTETLVGLIPEINRKVQALWRQAPTADWEYATVTFTSGGADVDIPHTLKVTDPEAVRWLVCAMNADTTVYQDTTATRLPWQANHIWLRAGAACTARLLLFLERSNA